MAVAALVLGLIGLLAGIVPFFFFIALPLGILAIIFGFVGRRKSTQRQASGKGMATSGIAMGAISIVLAIIGVVVINKAVDNASESFSSALEESLDESINGPLGQGSVPADLLASFAIDSGFTPNQERGLVSAGALVSNNGSQTVCGVEVQFTLLDSTGAPVDTATETLPIITAGQTLSIAPLQLGYQVAGAADLQVSIVGVSDTTASTSLDDCSGFYLEDGIQLDVQGSNYSRDDFGTSITGQLSNPSEQKIDTSYIDCVLRLGGKVVGGTSSASLDPIPPGGTVAFKIGFVEYEGDADEVVCTAIA